MLFLFAGCFDPAFHDPTCGPAGECPDGLSCMAGVCRAEAVVPDAPGGGIDANSDGGGGGLDGTPQDSAPACLGWAALNVNPCDPLLPAPQAVSIAGAATYDTDTFVLDSGGTTTPPHAVINQTGGPAVTVLNLTSLTIGSADTLVVKGSRPLIIVVHGDVTIAGTLDAASHRGPSIITHGAGAGDATSCGTGIGGLGGNGIGGVSAGGGGGGGAFGGSGGPGSDGAGSGHGIGGMPGTADTVPTLVPLRAGCHGGMGGTGELGFRGDNGRGGGAVEITASGTITVTGTILAGGTGGASSGGDNGGGGGGGSGGAILLDGAGTMVTSTAKLCANGGGGGAGGTSGGAIIAAAADATCSELVGAAGGIAAGGSGGNGGPGGYIAAPDGQAANGPCCGDGGGGGGGGVGRIRVHGRDSLSVVDEAATISPASVN